MVQLSGELAAAIPEDSAVAIDELVLTATAFSTGICRLEVEIVYTDGGMEVVAAGAVSPRDSAEENAAVVLLNAGTRADIEAVAEVPSDDEVEKDVTYVTNDLSHITVVDECSDAADDDFASLKFPYSVQPERPDAMEGDIHEFATAEVAVIPGSQGGSDGASIIITGDTDAELTATGQWAPPEY
ncbi:hypothetical protein [Brevibacterium daeguense]|uniref:hypothetical protein n=1 Tax=Brevibacterium daeguense TaxID=909936 RepID=UPI001F3AF119|nr:hypothetical protein [Brevibacterium daeguense]